MFKDMILSTFKTYIKKIILEKKYAVTVRNKWKLKKQASLFNPFATGYTRLRCDFVTNEMCHIFEIQHADETWLHAGETRLPAGETRLHA